MKHFYTISYKTILHDLLSCYIVKLIFIHLNLYIIHLYLIVAQDINKPLKQHFVKSDTSLVSSL